MQMTPMQEQYLEIKRKYPDCILLFRLGDFFEAFYEDAKSVSKVLGITLTGRGKGEGRIPMAGIPHHALKQYLPKLVRSGYRVALADQLEPAMAGKLVKREVTKVITAGTIIDENLLTEYENNYLAVLFYDKKSKVWGLAFADVSTGEFKIAQYPKQGENIPLDVKQELFRVRPSELIVSTSFGDRSRNNLKKFNTHLLPDADFDINRSRRILLENFKLKSLKAFGIEKYQSGIIAAGVLYQYLLDTQKTDLKHIQKIQVLQNRNYMDFDEITIRSLEILNNLKGNEDKTFFSVINHCLTPMGQRTLRSFVLRPLLGIEEITNRLDHVSEFIEHIDMLANTRRTLSDIIDNQRLISRIASGSCNARDFVYLKKSLEKALELFDLIRRSELGNAIKLIPGDSCLESIRVLIETIDTAIIEDPPVTITEGGMIRDGFNSELDDINVSSLEGKKYIRALEETERERTKISNLKVSFNNVFGYYIEITKSNLGKVPENYVRKQTLVNGERFITEDLKFWEEKVLNAQARASELEFKIFDEIRNNIIGYIDYISQTTEAIAYLDVYSNFAYISEEYKLVRPEISEERGFSTEIRNCRHIVVERSIQNEFIPNDLNFIPEEIETIILTGPNMSGKSTYIRQVALIFILAQIGCFVPADFAKLQIVDRIFTRIGAADNLAEGESTFMVEMNETANILNNATARSLIILDEVGRGTSTYDGLSIAWAVIEYIVTKLKARTLFATHFHELILLEDKLPGVKNFNVEVKERDGDVLFMHKIIPGGTDKSYGIHVAKLAGIPISVTSRAEDILRTFEDDRLAVISHDSIDYQDQLSFGTLQVDDYLRDEIKSIDINALTPIEALLKLKKIKEDLD